MVLKLCTHLKVEIQNHLIADCMVHSVYQAVVNLMTPKERLVSVTLSNKQVMPYGLVVDVLDGFNFRQGEALCFTKEGLYRNDYRLLSIRNVSTYDCGARLMWPLSNVQCMAEKRRVLRQEINAFGSQDGIAGLLTKGCGGEQAHQMFVKPVFNQFLMAYHQKDIAGIICLSERLCGYGIGLTPYMDDFLCGIMIAEYYAGLRVPEEAKMHRTVISAIMQNLEHKTNLISYNMLWQASEGLCSGGILDLMDVLLTEEDINLENYIRQVFRYGSSSGTDICCGILIGLSQGC